MKKIAKILAPLILVALFFLGGYVYGGLQFLPPHYHANFALYIDGKKFDFSGDQYMEDVSKCSLGNTVYPKDRAHLHENNGNTIHVHAAGVSWEQFFSNVGFTI